MWHKFEKGLYKTQEFLIAIALIVIMIAVILQIVGRLLGWHSLGMPEYAAIGMTTITFLGASAITYTREYISIELSQMIKIKNIQTIMNLIVDIILIIFVVVFFNIVYSFLKFVGRAVKNVRSRNSFIHYIWNYCIIHCSDGFALCK